MTWSANWRGGADALPAADSLTTTPPFDSLGDDQQRQVTVAVGAAHQLADALADQLDDGQEISLYVSGHSAAPPSLPSIGVNVALVPTATRTGAPGVASTA